MPVLAGAKLTTVYEKVTTEEEKKGAKGKPLLLLRPGVGVGMTGDTGSGGAGEENARSGGETWSLSVSGILLLPSYQPHLVINFFLPFRSSFNSKL